MTTQKTINPTEERGRYEYINEKGTTYLIDLSDANDSYGCDCPHFRYRCAPKLEEGAKRYTSETSCKHIKAVLHWLAVSYCKEFF